MSNIQNFYDLIERSIQQLGVDPITTRGQIAGQWSLVKGSAKVYIDCWHIESEGRSYFQVMAPVMQIPADRKESFYFDLLSFNNKLYSSAFVLHNDWAWVKMLRECDGLDQAETFAIISRVGHYADQYDDLLKAHYESAAAKDTADASGSR